MTSGAIEYEALAVDPRQAPRVGRPRGLVLASCLVVAIAVGCAILGSLIAPYNPNTQNLLLGLSGPSSGHLLGTDSLGRDVLSRLIGGTRLAIIGPLVAAACALVLSVPAGITAGYKGGVVDDILMRIADAGYALPSLLVVAVLVGVLGGGLILTATVLGVLFAPYDARVVRGVTLEQRPLPYVEAAQVLGLSDRQVMRRHILPNVLPFILVNVCIDFAFGLVTLAGLDFLGLGAGPASDTWGAMLASAQQDLFVSPVAVLAPSAAIVLLAVTVNILGDWFYESFRRRTVGGQ